MLNRRGVMKLFAVAALATPGIAAAGGRTDARPRTLANGRPACGNVMGKGEQIACEPAPTTLVTAPPAAPPRVADDDDCDTASRPRVLANGRPACGNVMNKQKSAAPAASEPTPTLVTAPPANGATLLAGAPPVEVKATSHRTKAWKARKARRTHLAKAGAR